MRESVKLPRLCFEISGRARRDLIVLIDRAGQPAAKAAEYAAPVEAEKGREMTFGYQVSAQVGAAEILV